MGDVQLEEPSAEYLEIEEPSAEALEIEEATAEPLDSVEVNQVEDMVTDPLDTNGVDTELLLQSENDEEESDEELFQQCQGHYRADLQKLYQPPHKLYQPHHSYQHPQLRHSQHLLNLLFRLIKLHPR